MNPPRSPLPLPVRPRHPGGPALRAPALVLAALLAGTTTAHAQNAIPPRVANATAVAQKIVTLLNQPYDIAGRVHRSSTSVGVSLFGAHTGTLEETLKRSSKDDAGDLSAYGQHQADAGTDTFDRDFALSLVSNEQEALAEIEAAIKRVHAGTYGICETTQKPIAKERLLAVPFTRYSTEAKKEVERHSHRSVERGGLFGDGAEEEGGKISDGGDDE